MKQVKIRRKGQLSPEVLRAKMVIIKQAQARIKQDQEIIDTMKADLGAHLAAINQKAVVVDDLKVQVVTQSFYDWDIDRLTNILNSPRYMKLAKEAGLIDVDERLIDRALTVSTSVNRGFIEQLLQQKIIKRKDIQGSFSVRYNKPSVRVDTVNEELDDS